MVIGLFIPCYIEAVFQEDVSYPRDQAYCGQRMAMNWNTPSIFPFIHSRVHSRCEQLFWMGRVSVRTRGPSAPRTR
jgi:hypothetical protein